MKVHGTHYRTIWADDRERVHIIDQRRLPHEFVVLELKSLADAAEAIRDMAVRGAPLIGATAAFGVALGLSADPSEAGLRRAVAALEETRPTAVNLRWALNRMLNALVSLPRDLRRAAAFAKAREIADEDVAMCRRIARHGADLIFELADSRQGARVNILTHCNAGWLATVDWGTALAPIYHAFDDGAAIHVWVDETRPRSQGAALTAWELQAHGIPCTLITDNAGGHLMQRGMVDMCLVGTDRTTATGDVANKIGTYLKALAARDNGIPFYVALPHSTIDWNATDGLREIPIEERSPVEVLTVTGRTADGAIVPVDVAPSGTRAANPAFDVTPARLVSALITDRGVCPASRDGLLSLFPERA
jgi:methylthioribose-1-phosphate isomerase